MPDQLSRSGLPSVSHTDACSQVVLVMMWGFMLWEVVPTLIGRTYKVQLCSPDRREPVWPSGKALDWQAEGPRFESASALLHLQKLWSVDTVL